jgi:hypothetical protein
MRFSDSEKMRPALRRMLFALASAAMVLAGVLLLANAPARAPAQTSASGPPSGAEGPTGRTALASWTLALDPTDRGLRRGWQRGGFRGRRVSVPNVVDARDIKGAAGWRNFEGSVAWYRTTFTAPTAGTYALSFSSANYRASVFVDGRALVTHRGSYLPFEARAALLAGTHTAVVRIDWRDPTRQVSEGFHRTWFNWGGLDGPVSVRKIEETELAEPAIAVQLQPREPNAAHASVRVDVLVTNHGPARTITPAGALRREDASVPLHFAARAFAAGESATMSASATVEHPALWAPGHPDLYELQLWPAPQPGGTEMRFEAPVFSARVGLRELSRRGSQLYLNGRRLLLHGASLMEDAPGHGDALTPSDDDRLVSELRTIGANAVRSQHPLSRTLLEKLDAAGILVWQGIGPAEGAGNWHETTTTLRRGAEAEAVTTVRELALHPSIIAWNLVDELAENGHSAAELAYVRSLTAWLHRHDPGRLVALEVWGTHAPSVAGAIYSGADAVAETDYTGWYDDATASAARQRGLMRARLAAMERTFPGRVLLISEFGAEANALNAPGSPGSYSFQSRLLALHISVYEHDPKLTGMLVWNLRDYPLIPAYRGGSILARVPHVQLIEGMLQKGLFTYAGSPKPAARTVARLFKALPAA